MSIRDIGPATKAVAVTASATEFAPCRGLWVGTAGTATIETVDGTTLTDFPLKEGYNPIACQKITAMAASDVWRLY